MDFVSNFGLTIVLAILTGQRAHCSSCTKWEDKLLDMVVDCRSGEGTDHALGKNRPAFTATIASQPTLSGTSAIVKFDNVILNRGGGYDPKTGIFTAPKTGLYQISATIMSHGGKVLHIQITKNGQRVMYLYGPAIHGGTETANPVLELKSGDKVYVKHNHSGSERIYGDHYSHFSGYYISK